VHVVEAEAALDAVVPLLAAQVVEAVAGRRAGGQAVDVAVQADDVEPARPVHREGGDLVEVATAAELQLAVAVQEVLRRTAGGAHGPQVGRTEVAEDVEPVRPAGPVVDVAAGDREAGVERGRTVIVEDRVGQAGWGCPW
jgi:hypothetical protein